MIAHWLPVILFFLAGLMAFSTGTSWVRSVSCLLSQVTYVFPNIAPILPSVGGKFRAGSVFVTTVLQISDTTILSSLLVLVVTITGPRIYDS
ncbi:hypothetical protein O9993_12830 [Vibrio lentus]|nr:hypothetical protein [Vibrio lentus]